MYVRRASGKGSNETGEKLFEVLRNFMYIKGKKSSQKKRSPGVLKFLVGGITCWFLLA